jgi:hypothetical protein
LQEDPAEGTMERALLEILNSKIDVSFLRFQRLKEWQRSNNTDPIIYFQKRAVYCGFGYL